MSVQLVFTALTGLPRIRPGDDLVEAIWLGLGREGMQLQLGDVIVVTQKVVSKAEGRHVNLDTVKPSPRALELAADTGKDARLVEVILQESRGVLRTRPGSIIVEHRLGFVCANAGVDHSNVESPDGSPGEWVLRLPADPDRSAAALRQSLQARSGVGLGLLISDSHGRAWRLGTVGVAVGAAGFPALLDCRGLPDLFGYTLQATQVGLADEVAAGASALMGQAAEGWPVVHVRGVRARSEQGKAADLIRPLEEDLFR
ncbi:MAG: coenzyme F420-0:L-glutamate ligase [Anaerolineales bacterium]|nr:coenzyme F420-0:L-glutamate ligase [Anaerolineales bacterium]